MTGQTDVNGGTTTKDFGPYLQQTPANPLNTNSKVATGIVDATTSTSFTAGTGFYVNTGNGKVWATNQLDTKLFDEVTGDIIP
jgi:hypothetical protein